MTGIRLTYAGHARARAIGWYATALSAGAVSGQLAGGLLVGADLAGTGWRAIFLVNVPVCLAAVAAARRCLPAGRERVAAGLDLRGAGLLAGSVLLIVVPLVIGPQHGWPAWSWACLAAAAPGCWLFLTAQRRAAAAGRPVLVNLSAVRPAPVALGLIALAAATSTYYALLFTLAQYEQQGLGHSPVTSGLIMVPWVGAFGLAGRLAPRLPSRMARALPAAGCAVLTLAYASISLSLFDGERGELLLLALLAVGGFGLGVQFATLVGHLMGAVAARFAADISGVSSTLSQLGGAIGVAGIGSLYLSVARAAGPARATHAAAIATAAMAAVALAAAVAAYFATRPRATVGRPSASTANAATEEHPISIETGAT
jgi:predicted MFS family arabinose efflux permease